MLKNDQQPLDLLDDDLFLEVTPNLFSDSISTISTETRCKSRFRLSYISTLQSTATRIPIDHSRITFPARSNQSLFNSTLRNASYTSSSAIQTSSNRPLSASTLQSVTYQSNEPVTNIITPTLYSQSQQSSASQTLSQATESTTTQSTMSQPIATLSGGATTVQPDSFRLGVNQSLTTTISGSSIEIPSLQTQPFSTTSIQSGNMLVQSNLLPGFLTNLDQQIDNEPTLDLLPAVLSSTSAMERETSAASTNTNVSVVDFSQATAVISSTEKNM